MRFTLKTMMLAVIVSSVICTIFFVLPSLLAVCVLSLIWVLLPPALIAGLVYGRGYGRAFCIGCVSTGGCLPFVYVYMLMAALSGFDFTELDAESTLHLKIYSVVLFVLIGMSGCTAIVVRWLSVRRVTSPPAPESTASPYTVIHGRVAKGPQRSNQMQQYRGGS